MPRSNGLPENPRCPLLLGHRGASKYLPENTFEAFDLALQHGCDGFELDVRRTSDNIALICHDRDRKGKLLADCPAEKFTGLLNFDEVMQRYSSRCFLNVELKVEELHDAVLECFQKHRPSKGFLVSSFKPEALIPLYQQNPGFPLGLICKTSQQLSVWGQVPIDAIFAHVSLLSEELRSLTAKAGKQLFVWTVNRERDMHRFAQMGVDGIISDDTALLAKTFDRTHSAPASALP